MVVQRREDAGPAATGEQRSVLLSLAAVTFVPERLRCHPRHARPAGDLVSRTLVSSKIIHLLRRPSRNAWQKREIGADLPAIREHYKCERSPTRQLDIASVMSSEACRDVAGPSGPTCLGPEFAS